MKIIPHPRRNGIIGDNRNNGSRKNKTRAGERESLEKAFVFALNEIESFACLARQAFSVWLASHHQPPPPPPPPSSQTRSRRVVSVLMKLKATEKVLALGNSILILRPATKRYGMTCCCVCVEIKMAGSGFLRARTHKKFFNRQFHSTGELEKSLKWQRFTATNECAVDNLLNRR